MTYKPCPKCGYRYTLRRRCRKCDPKPKKKRGDGHLTPDQKERANDWHLRHGNASERAYGLWENK